MTVRIAVDGYWASGKSVIAAMLAGSLGAVLIRPYTDETAAELLGYVEHGDFERLDGRAREILGRADRAAEGRDAVFDRHWFSVAVHLPETFHSRWDPRPRTYVCWADPETTARRLRARVEHEPDVAQHARAAAAHRALAEQLGLPVLDTSRCTPAESAAFILDDLARRPPTT